MKRIKQFFKKHKSTTNQGTADGRVDGQQMTDQSATRQGLSLLYLLSDTRSWVHRRIDSVRLSSEGATRRHVSLDVTIPVQGAIYASNGERLIVPVSWMPKGPATRLDATRDGSGLVVLGKNEHTELIVRMLTSALRGLPLTRRVEVGDEDVFKRVLNAADSKSATESLAKFSELLEGLVSKTTTEQAHLERIEAIETIVKLLSTHYVMMVEISARMIGIRCTVKYSFEVPSLDITDGRPIEILWSVSDFQFSSSQHFEVEVPKNLRIQRMRFIAFDEQDKATQVQDVIPVAESHSAHAVIRPRVSDVKADVAVTVQPTRRGVYAFTLWSWRLFSVLIVASIMMRIFDKQILGKVDIPSSSASIILIAPAILISWVSREQEHTIVSRLLSPLRKILLYIAALLVCVAGLVAVSVAPMTWHILWMLIYIAWCGLSLYAIRVFRGYQKPLR